MPEHISIAEAIKRYPISDKTIRNWIKANILPAERIMVAGRWQYSINPTDLEQIMAAHNIYQPLEATRSDSSRLDDLERRVAELEHLVHDLRAAREPQDATIDYAVTPPRKAAPASSQREKQRKDKYLAEKIQTYKNKSHP